MTNEKPILFNTEMVRAILEGRKTVTRRVIKQDIINRCDIDTDGSIIGYCDGNGDWWNIERLCRYQIGDILYVRETWARLVISKGGVMQSERYVYKATDKYPFEEHDYIVKFRWKPSIHMPKEAARIWLKVTDVRVERLQDMTVEDCKAEGIYDDYKTISQEYHDMLMERAYPKTFKRLWDSTIKKSDLDRYGWDANPWVWVIGFERIER